MGARIRLQNGGSMFSHPQEKNAHLQSWYHQGEVVGLSVHSWVSSLLRLSLFCVTQHLSMPLSQYSAAPVVMLKATGITKLNQIKCVQQVFPSPDGLAIKFR